MEDNLSEDEAEYEHSKVSRAEEEFPVDVEEMFIASKLGKHRVKYCSQT
jgi:hypothetical protein